ncbi:MAG: hypothetical protein K2X47_01020 [Bdellovibrionales bacterium]|nr:hypothetical protein [Bdellovibrionales bacterium]
MMNQKMTKAGKVLFLGSLLMTSVGLSPRHLMLASNDDVQFISLASTTDLTGKGKTVRKTIGGNLYEIKAAKPTTSEEFDDADDVKTKTKIISTTEVTYRQLKTGTEACVECLEGSTTVQVVSDSDKKDSLLPLADIEKAITTKLGESKLKKEAAEKLAKEEEAKKDYKTCAKIPPALKKLHDSDEVARAACYLLAADETLRKDGNANSSFHWIELRKQIAAAALSNRPEDRALMNTLDSWVHGSRVQLGDDKVTSDVARSLITEIKDTLEGNKRLADYKAREEAIERSIFAIEEKFQRAEDAYRVAQERETEALSDPRCSFNFMCWSRYRTGTDNAMKRIEKVRAEAGKFESRMMRINPRSLSAFEIKRPSDGGILPVDMNNYFERYGETAHRLVDYTQNYDWLNQFDRDQLQNQGRLPYEMVGARDPNYGLQTPIVNQGIVGNFAGRNLRGGSGGLPMVAGNGRSGVNSTSAFSLQAFSGMNRPYTGVDLGIPYNSYSSGLTPYSPTQTYRPQTQLPMFQQQPQYMSPMRGNGMVAI